MSEIRPTSPVPTAYEPPASVLRPNFGSDKAPSAEVPGMPFNYGEGLLPHVVTFQGIISSVSRVYRYYDEAMKASLENARFMRNDLMIMEPVEQRRRACALLNWHLEVDDQDNPTEKKLAEDLTKILRQIPNFLKFRENLLDAVWYGKYAVQFAWKWKRLRGVTAVNGLGQNMVIDHWKPLHGDKVVFRYDDGTREYDPNQVGIRVGAGYTAGDKGIQGRMSASGRRKVEPTDYGLAYFLEPWERRLLAIHKHMIEDGEYEDPQSAGKIHGVGIRSRIYWTWYMKQECFAHLLEFLERSATGVEIWYYPWGNPEAEAKVRVAAEERIGNARNVILMPRPVGEDAQAFGVEIVQQNVAGIEALKVLVEEYFGNAIMRYVLGQTMTNKPQAGGFGSELPTVQLGTYLQIIKYDSLNLGETMTTDVVDVLKANNYPHLLDIPCRFVLDTESEDAEGKLQAWKMAYDCGVKTKSGDWLKMIGASKPEEDDEIVQNPVTMQQDRLYQQFIEHKQQAAAMGMTPEGTPQPGEAPAQVQGGLGEELPPEMGMEAEGPQQFSLEAHDSPQGGPWIDRTTEAKGEKYLMPDGSRMADEGIREGRTQTDWTIPAARHTYAAGGPAGQPAVHTGEQGGSGPASMPLAESTVAKWTQEGKVRKANSEVSEPSEPPHKQGALLHGLKDAPGQQDLVNADKGAEPNVEDTERDHAVVNEWKQRIQQGDRTPVYVDAQDSTRVVDGNHRLVAYRALDIKPPIVAVDRVKFLTAASKMDNSPESLAKAAEQAKPVAQPDQSGETAKERAARVFKETQEKFADEAASTETISEREARRKAEGSGEKRQRHAAGSLYGQLLERYYKASTDEAQERFWAGDEREIVVIQDEKPMRYSRKHGQVSASYVMNEAI